MAKKIDEAEWLSHLIPLPHEIAIEGAIELSPGDVSVRTVPGAGEIEKQAAQDLVQLWIGRAGCEPSGSGFEILIGVCNEAGKLAGRPVDTGRLRSLPNRDQAYTIRPDGDRCLILSALDGKGVCYAAQTLHQLLEPHLSEDRVTIPLVSVTDWPDLDERGLWNFPDPESWVPWMASVKLNYGKMASAKPDPVERDRPNRLPIDTTLMQEARLKAFNYLPYILHLNFLHDYGLFRTHPELAGKGDGALAGRYFAHKSGSQHRAPCAAKPLFVEILTEWMNNIASQGADEISCWLSERPCQCSCDTCTSIGQFVLETRAFVAAWREAQRDHPDLKIRIFMSTTTTVRNYRLLAELPPEVKLERACATGFERVPRIPRDLLANPLMDHYAADGRWIASYDVPIGASGLVDTPEFKLPQSSPHRIRDFVGQLARRAYSGAYGMMAWATMGKETSSFCIQALAEWSWNLKGRSEREFAVAWATREKYGDPQAAGDWAVLMGPVEFDVYDSDFPVCYSWGKAVQMVRERQRPYLGEGMFRYYASADDFDRKRDRCRQALEIAEAFETPHLANETRVVLSYVDLADAIYRIAEQVATQDLTDLTIQSALREGVDRLKRSGDDNAAAIRAWRGALGPEPWHQRVHDAIRATETTVAEISEEVLSRYLY